MENIYIVCAAILLFLGGSFLFEQKKTQTHYIIIAWIIIEFFTQISYYLLETNGLKSNVTFFQIISGTHLLHAPLFYLFVLSLLEKNFLFTRKTLIHLAPVFFFYLIHLPELSKIIGFSACSTHFSCYLINKPCSILFNSSKLLLNTFYLVLTLFTYREISSRNEKISYEQKLDRGWVKTLLIGAFAINFVVVVIILCKISRIEIFSTKLFLINFISTCFVILFCFIYLNYRGIVHFTGKLGEFFKAKKIVKGEQIEKTNQVGLINNGNEGSDFSLSDELLIKYRKQVIQYIEDKKPYLDHHLTKEKFSKKTGIPQHHLTIVLRECFQKNFTDFINTYRLQTLIEKLEKSQNQTFTLLGLAYDCGFNSKSTFNRFFKQQMGVTPTEWLKTTPLSNKIDTSQ